MLIKLNIFFYIKKHKNYQKVMFSVLFLLDSETIETIANKGGGKSGVEKGLSIHSVNKILVFWCLGGGVVVCSPWVSLPPSGRADNGHKSAVITFLALLNILSLSY